MDGPVWIVTGGAGFIGSAFVRLARARGLARVVTLDLLTYAGNLDNLAGLAGDPGHRFVHGDICDADTARAPLRRGAARGRRQLRRREPRRPLDPGRRPVPAHQRARDPGAARRGARAPRRPPAPAARDAFRFLHVSTDEVYGTLGPDDPAFTEATPYAPNSPYAASKAAADHLVRAAHHTWGLPTLVTNCSNNYGPYQFPEKLIPLVICNARDGKPLPVYGDGLQVRDWLHVDDHCEALLRVLAAGGPGETYNVGGGNERTNIETVRAICARARRAGPRRFAPRAADPPRRRPPRPRPPLRDRRREDPPRARLGAAHALRGGAARHGRLVPGQRRLGRARAHAAPTGSGWRPTTATGTDETNGDRSIYSA